jgi:hypothetical protein
MTRSNNICNSHLQISAAAESFIGGSRTPSSLAMAGGPAIVPVPFFLGAEDVYFWG